MKMIDQKDRQILDDNGWLFEEGIGWTIMV
jgi:hypothetical protein